MEDSITQPRRPAHSEQHRADKGCSRPPGSRPGLVRSITDERRPARMERRCPGRRDSHPHLGAVIRPVRPSSGKGSSNGDTALWILRLSYGSRRRAASAHTRRIFGEHQGGPARLERATSKSITLGLRPGIPGKCMARDSSRSNQLSYGPLSCAFALRISGGRVSNPLSGDHSPRCRAANTTPYRVARQYRRRESNARPPGS